MKKMKLIKTISLVLGIMFFTMGLVPVEAIHQARPVQTDGSLLAPVKAISRLSPIQTFRSLLSPGDTCDEQNACSGANEECVSGACQCVSGYHAEDGTCVVDQAPEPCVYGACEAVVVGGSPFSYTTCQKPKVSGPSTCAEFEPCDGCTSNVFDPGDGDCEPAGVCPLYGNELVAKEVCVAMACTQQMCPRNNPNCNTCWCTSTRIDYVPVVESVPDGHCGVIQCEATGPYTGSPNPKPKPKPIIPVTGVDQAELAGTLLRNLGMVIVGLGLIRAGMRKKK